jgi:hypothetical protein
MNFLGHRREPMLPERGRTLKESGYFRKIEKEGFWSLSTETHPDQVERRTHAEEKSNERENLLVKEVIEPISDAAPDQEAREEVAEDRPESTFGAAV